MGVNTMSAAEHQISETFHARIVANNKHLAEELENGNLQIRKLEHFAIALATDQAHSGKVGTAYPAYPIDRTGKIHTNIHLIVKEIELNRWKPAAHDKRFIDYTYKHIEEEAKNGSELYSTGVAKTKNGGMILMSKVPGAPLLTLIGTPALDDLAPIQRIQLCINILNPYKKLHAQGIFHRDATAGNILLHLNTRRAMPIDIDPAHDTELTRAPEKEISIRSNLFSIVLDMFIPILSGVRPQRSKNGETLNTKEIANGIIKNFGEELSSEVMKLLTKLTADNPDVRGTLEEAQEGFLYSIASDIFIFMLSGIHPLRNEIGETTNIEEIVDNIDENFGELSDEVIALLTQLTSDDPEDRGTLEDGQQALEKLECIIESKKKTVTCKARRSMKNSFLY